MKKPRYVGGALEGVKLDSQPKFATPIVPEQDPKFTAASGKATAMALFNCGLVNAERTTRQFHAHPEWAAA